MPGLPRYAIFVVLGVLGTFYWLSTYQETPTVKASRYIHDGGISERLKLAESIYEKTLTGRKKLIQTFGPKPEDIDMFPPDKNPWPAYTVWDFFPPSFNCPHELERIGSLGDGGKWVCGLSRIQEKPDCLIYSMGINYESSFEAEILDNTRHCQIYGYDSTTKSFGPQIPRTQSARAHFTRVGLSGTTVPANSEHGPSYPLETIMEKNGHDHIDILRVDVESAEFDTFAAMLAPYVRSGKPLPFGQLLLEIHVWNKNFASFLSWWELFESAGLRPFSSEPNLVYQNYNKQANSDLAEYSFLNIRGDNIFIKDPSRPFKVFVDEPLDGIRPGHDVHAA
ncbi:hypothetical protein CYLTODRAFT_422660 [Cylindrobasidium torrendii FP15055 ss-10]|uniref:Methyltransferase domain-containing protein n=1 Tax=Cylindrobasidium torrendii FP15055 ss-10 TaxID=1314674 RepID=A0A0D7B9V1_9AGAR|nr:hypothetical protein CYLTODRAFT_422660 [Cylindrobasidium torrendii FP15055 ss-10]